MTPPTRRADDSPLPGATAHTTTTTAATTPEHVRVAVIGGGPAGLMAAEVLAAGGAPVHLFDAMPSVGRKFLMAGKGGMNITHSEAMAPFVSRYGAHRDEVAAWLADFGPEALRAWIHDLGIDTFVGSSGRVFPADMKAAPLLRAWLARLRAGGVHFHVRHRWLGWGDDGALRFATPAGEARVRADAVVLALGGGSWARLGADGAWVPWLQAAGVAVAPLAPANCGFHVGPAPWSAHFVERCAGQAVKPVRVAWTDADGINHQRKGEFMVTHYGVEGGLVYALSSMLRERITATGQAVLHLDLLPDLPAQRVAEEVARPRGARSLSSHLQSRLGLKGVKAGLLRELLGAEAYAQPQRLAAAIKSLPLTLVATRPLDEAISSAGGVRLTDVDDGLMLRALPGVFCAGELLDWEAPTGGYLLTACFASGHVAGRGALAWLHART